MARLGASKKKKSPRATELSQLKKELQRVTEQLESRDREQAATSEILRVIASSPTEIQPVLSVVAESAARLCDATDAMIGRFDGSALWLVAHYGSIPRANALGEQVIFSRGVVHGRAIIDRQTIHVHDIAAEIETEFPDARPYTSVLVLAPSLLRHCYARVFLLG